jgi:transposase
MPQHARALRPTRISRGAPGPSRVHLGGGYLPQLELLHLAAGRHGEGIQRHSVLRYLEAGQLPPAERDQRLLGDLRTGLGNDAGARDLAEARVRDADNLHLINRRMPEQKALHLSAMVRLAEVVDFQRFRRPRALMAYLGLVPSEYSSGETPRRGGLTKAGHTHARRVLVEAAWPYRHRPTAGRALARRSQAQPEEVVGQAWRAHQRLHRRYRHLVGHGKRPPVAVAAIARELVGFLWAAMTRRETRPHVA